MVNTTNNPSESIEITGDRNAANMAHFYLVVGQALSTWALIESNLCRYYCMLVCGHMAPVEGAITTYSTLRSFDDRMNVISKCLDQVLYPSSFDSFRKQAKKNINRLKTISEIRNKIAHGLVSIDATTDTIEFCPYYSEAASYRKQFLTQNIPSHPSTVKKPIVWDIKQLVNESSKLTEAQSIVERLVADLALEYEEKKEFLQETVRMRLHRGLPFPGSQDSRS